MLLAPYRDMRVALAIVTALLLASPRAEAKPACTGPLATSCAKKLYKCFKPKGACVGELVFSPTGVSTLQCWENGATISIEATEAGGTVEYRGARGRKCLRGTIVVESEDDAAFVFKRKAKTWTIRPGTEGGIVITCPDGSVETYTEDEVNQEPPSCGGYSESTACTMGDCP